MTARSTCGCTPLDRDRVIRCLACNLDVLAGADPDYACGGLPRPVGCALRGGPCRERSEVAPHSEHRRNDASSVKGGPAPSEA